MFEDLERFFPEDQAMPIAALDLSVGEPVPACFERDKNIIAANWSERCGANPYLFNGTVFLIAGLELKAGRLCGCAVQLDYASFLHWRGNAPFQSEAALTHVFALAALESSDGHLIAMRSASTTVNAGQTYFAAGSFDGEDVVSDKLDAFGNMCREVGEETGLDLEAMKREGAFVAFRTRRFVAVFQRFVSPLNALSLVSNIKAFAQSQTTPEIDDAVIIRSPSDIASNMPGYMQAYCRWRLEG
jgi:8-oxo-dGTP pyrophosphatase MutT (NUDIX family)